MLVQYQKKNKTKKKLQCTGMHNLPAHCPIERTTWNKSARQQSIINKKKCECENTATGSEIKNNDLCHVQITKFLLLVQGSQTNVWLSMSNRKNFKKSLLSNFEEKGNLSFSFSVFFFLEPIYQPLKFYQTNITQKTAYLSTSLSIVSVNTPKFSSFQGGRNLTRLFRTCTTWDLATIRR